MTHTLRTSPPERQELERKRTLFSEAYAKFRKSLPQDLDLAMGKVLEENRDPSPGRDHSFEE